MDDTDTATLAPVNIGDRCVYCDADTAPGSGNFVNRIPADGYFDGDMETHPQLRIGYMCADCQCFDCDDCGQIIPADDDTLVLDGDDTLRLCRECCETREVVECFHCGDGLLPGNVLYIGGDKVCRDCSTHITR